MRKNNKKTKINFYFIKSIGKLWKLFSHKEKRNTYLIILLTLICTCFEVMGVGLLIPTISIIIDENFLSKYPTIQIFLLNIGIDSHIKLIVFFLLIAVAIYLVKNVYLGFFELIKAKYIFRIKSFFSHALFEKYLAETYEIHMQKNSAKLLRNITTEMQMLVGSVLKPTLIISTELIVFSGLSVFLLIIEPIGFLSFTSIVFIAMFIFELFAREKLSTLGKRRRKHEGLRVKVASEGFAGFKEAKMMGKESILTSKYFVSLKHSINAQAKFHFISRIPRLWLESVAIIGLVVLILTVVLRSSVPSNALPIIGAFAVVAIRILSSANKLMSSVLSLQYAKPVIDMLANELKEKQAITERNNIDQTFSFNSDIRIDNVYYSYPSPNKTVLTSITFAINKGESVGIIGESGAGKSTLIEIIIGLLKPTSGKVLVDGKDIQTSLRAWQSKIGYVPQDIFISDDTFRQNIAFGVPDNQIDEDLLWFSINSANLINFAKGLKNGIDTQLGELGVKISGGQKQRIGIARALYHNPSLLVLDEATNSLDKKTEAAIVDEVNSLQGTRTIIIISHRLTAVKNCSSIYRIKNGCLKRLTKPPLKTLD